MPGFAAPGAVGTIGAGEVGIVESGAGGGAMVVMGAATPPPTGFDGDSTVTEGGCTAWACAGAWTSMAAIPAKPHINVHR